MRILRTRDELALARPQWPGQTGLVPTMGALHDGHLALVAQARAECETVAASIFVNPTQFNAAEDLARYPRDEVNDLAKLAAAGCDAVWMPEVAAMYPPGDSTMVDPSGPAQDWEGTHRPGHFRGMATVVAKLFGLVRPDVAYFGEKDWQQLQVVTRMVADLLLPVRIAGVPTVREADGLAMSSRNRFLSVEDRERAPLLYATLLDVAAALRHGAEPDGVLAEGRAGLEAAGFGVDYLALVEAATLRPTQRRQGARLIAVARLGGVRLLDNMGLDTAG